VRYAAARESAWRTGPPKWAFSAYGILLATVHLVLAGAGVGRWLELWDGAWPFYGTLLAITSGSAVAIHYARRRRPSGEVYGAPWGGDPYGYGGGYGEGVHGGGEGLDLPRAPVGER